MDFKQLSNKAKELVEKRGGSDSVKEDAEELKEIAKGEGSAADKAKAAVSAIKEPGADEPDAPAAEAASSPSAQGPRRRSRARQGASTSMRASAAAAADAGAAAEAVAARPDRAAAELIDWRVMRACRGWSPPVIATRIRFAMTERRPDGDERGRARHAADRGGARASARALREWGESREGGKRGRLLDPNGDADLCRLTA